MIPVLYPWLNKGWGNLRVWVALCTPGGIPVPFSRANWLPSSWQHDVKCILSSSQGDRPIADWICLLELTNAVLVGTTDHLSPDMIHSHIKTHLHVDTLIASCLTEVHLIKLYTDFIKAIKLIDDMCLRHTLLLQEVVAHMLSTSTINTTNTVRCKH